MAKVGRPTVFTPEVIGKLEYAAALDSSVEEMAFYAGINKDTLYSKLQDDQEFSQRIQSLRNRPIMKARETAVTKLAESYSNAMDYLKRKKRLEFGDNVDLTSQGEKLPQPLLNINEILKDDIVKEDSTPQEED